MPWLEVSKVTAILGIIALISWACIRFVVVQIILSPLLLIIGLIILVASIVEYSPPRSSSWSEAQNRMFGNYLLLSSFALFTISLVAFATYSLQ